MERLDGSTNEQRLLDAGAPIVTADLLYAGPTRRRSRAHHGLTAALGGFGDKSHESQVSEVEKERIRQIYLSNVDGLDVYLRLRGENVVDIYNSPPTTNQPIEEEEATVKIKESLVAMRKTGLENLPPEWTAVYTQTLNMLAYRQAYKLFKEAQEKGETVPFNRDTVLREIGGIEPKQPSWDKLVQRRDRFAAILSRILGTSVPRDEKGLREAYTAYQAANRITGTQEEVAQIIQKEVTGHGKRQFDVLGKAIGIDMRPLSDETDPNFVKVYVDSDDNAWTMWSVRGPDLKRVVRVNGHPRQLSMLDHGSMEGWTWHEDVMHAGSSYAQQLEIESGKLDEIAGRLFIPGGWHLKEEAIAMRANHLLANEGQGLSLPALAFQEDYGQYVIARAAALREMYAYGLTPEQAAERYHQFNFLKPPENFLKDLVNGSTNPFWIPYFEHYRRGEEAFCDYLDRTKADPYRGGRLRTLVTRPMNPEQFSRHIQVKI